jgi:S-formylglutathione hydrolase
MDSSIQVLGEHACFGGVQQFCRHDSRVTGLPMRFSLFLPPQARAQRVPLLVYLAGLTCTEETFAVKAGAQRVAAELGLALLAPDTSPRDARIPGESEHWDFGVGAGFWLDATEEPWRRHWRMESWLMEELLPLVGTSGAPNERGGQGDSGEQGADGGRAGEGRQAGGGFQPVDLARLAVFGHSMGGHGALTLALRNPGRFRSVSAFAPIAAPIACPWGQKAFQGYLGDDREAWKAHDASELMRTQLRAPYPDGILIDQGMDDRFLAEQLHPEVFEAACAEVGQPLELRRHPGYDHGYYFIASFIEDHLRFHARALLGA